jgi:hypothetical protein
MSNVMRAALLVPFGKSPATPATYTYAATTKTSLNPSWQAGQRKYWSLLHNLI